MHKSSEQSWTALAVAAVPFHSGVETPLWLNFVVNWQQILAYENWLAYYRYQGSHINAGCIGCGPSGGPAQLNGAFISPTMQWAVPSSALLGPPTVSRGMFDGAWYPPGGPMPYPSTKGVMMPLVGPMN
jgi:hypothetical protein